MGGQYHSPAALLPGKTRYLWHRRLLGPQAGLDGCGNPFIHYTYYAIPVANIIIIIIIRHQLGLEFL